MKSTAALLQLQKLSVLLLEFEEKRVLRWEIGYELAAVQVVPVASVYCLLGQRK